MPVDNRICYERWVEKNQKEHRHRVKYMKFVRTPALDNTTPSTMGMPHLQLKQKKAQLEEERFAQIERENRVLLEKMSKIMRQDPGDARSCHGGHHTEQFPFRSTLQLKPGIRVDMTQYPMLDSRNFVAPKSLNREARLRELKRITAENQGMLRRIQSRQPYYDHQEWERDRVVQLGYLKNIANREIASLSTRMRSSSASLLPPLTKSGKPGTAPAGTLEGTEDMPAAAAEETAAEA